VDFSKRQASPHSIFHHAEIAINRVNHMIVCFWVRSDVCGAMPHVCFGSKADMCSAKHHVRFTPDSDRKSRHPHKVMSALPPKADMCTALNDVC
jgi:hypothetical protein